MRIWSSIIALLFAGILNAQVPGSVVDPAAPAINPLDPNGDGFVTSTGTAFAGPYDHIEFEIPFIALQQFQAEPGADNQFRPGCEFYELVSDASSNAYPGYYYFSNPDGVADNGDEIIYFRFRVARYYDNELTIWRGEINGSVSEAESTYFYIIKAMDLEPITGYIIVKP